MTQKEKDNLKAILIKLATTTAKLSEIMTSISSNPKKSEKEVQEWFEEVSEAIREFDK